MSIELYTVKFNENKGVVEIIQPPGGISVRELGVKFPLVGVGIHLHIILIHVSFYIVEFVYHIEIRVLVHLFLKM